MYKDIFCTKKKVTAWRRNGSGGKVRGKKKKTCYITKINISIHNRLILEYGIELTISIRLITAPRKKNCSTDRIF